MTNWGQIKFEFEKLGRPPKQIAANHGVSLKLLENTIEQEGWSMKSLALAMSDFCDSDRPAEIMVDVAEKAALLNTLRAVDIGPEYYAAERAFLLKITEIISHLEATDDDAARQIKNIADALASLKPEQAKAEQKDTGVTVNILQHFEEGCDNTPTVKIDGMG